MTTSQEQFLILLRAGLWGESIDEKKFQDAVNWNEIYDIARIQAVLGVVYDGVIRLPKEFFPDKTFLMRWFALVGKIEQKHSLLNHTLAKIISFYYEHGFHPILLKGQGCAANYENPLRRQCGDLDIWIGNADFRRANDLIASKGIKCIELKSQKPFWYRFFLKIINRETWLIDKHMQFHVNGVTIENHRVPTRFFNPKNDRRFGKMVKKYLWRTERKMDVEGVKVVLPPILFDVIFTLYHAAKHYMLSGVGFRQLCDWARMLHVYRYQIDVNVLQKEIKRLRMQRTWGIFGYIAVHYLGLPASEMPIEFEKYAQIGDEIVACIMQEGNFGKNKMAMDLRPIGYHRGEPFSLKWLFKRIGHLGYIYPTEERWYFISDLRMSLKNKKKC